MFFRRDIRPALFSIDVMIASLRERREQSRASARARLQRKQMRDIARAALVPVVMTATVTAIVALKWVVWSGYFNH